MRNECKQSMPDVMLQIVERYGPEIIYQNERLIGLFRDFAPKLDREYKLLKTALDEDIAQSFKDCPADERGMRIQSTVEKLSQTMEKSDAELVVSSFAAALGWDEMRVESTENNGAAQKESSSDAATQSVDKQAPSDETSKPPRDKPDDPSEDSRLKKMITWGSIILAIIIVIAAKAYPTPEPDKPLPPSKQGTVLESPTPKRVLLDMKTVINSEYRFSLRIPKDAVKFLGRHPAEIDAYQDKAGKFFLVISLIKMGNDFSFSKLSPVEFEKFKAEFKEEMAYNRYEKEKVRGLKAEFLDEGVFSMNGHDFLWLKGTLHIGKDSFDVFSYATVHQGNLFIFDYCSNPTADHTPNDYILTSLNSLKFN